MVLLQTTSVLQIIVDFKRSKLITSCWLGHITVNFNETASARYNVTIFGILCRSLLEIADSVRLRQHQ